MLAYYPPAAFSMLQLVLIAAIGFILVRLKKVDDRIIRILSTFLINIALPCWLFSKLIVTRREDLLSSLLFPVAGIIVIATGLFLGFLLFAGMKYTASVKRSGTALCGMGNSGYLPLSISETLPVALPVIVGVLPDETAALYIGMYLVTMNPILWTLGNWLVTGGVGKPRVGQILTPPAVSVIVGIVVVLLDGGRLFGNNGSIFFYVAKTAETLGHTALPAVLISLGGMIALASEEGFHRDRQTILFTGNVMGTRLLLMPGLFFLFYFSTRSFVQLQPVQYWVLFLEMTTPPATNLSVMAARAGRNQDLVAQTLFFSYLAYFIIFPLYLAAFLSLPIFH